MQGSREAEPGGRRRSMRRGAAARRPVDAGEAELDVARAGELRLVWRRLAGVRRPMKETQEIGGAGKMDKEERGCEGDNGREKKKKQNKRRNGRKEKR